MVEPRRNVEYSQGAAYVDFVFALVFAACLMMCASCRGGDACPTCGRDDRRAVCGRRAKGRWCIRSLRIYPEAREGRELSVSRDKATWLQWGVAWTGVRCSKSTEGPKGPKADGECCRGELWRGPEEVMAIRTRHLRPSNVQFEVAYRSEDGAFTRMSVGAL